ncbi:hypothetical protein MAR_023475 [Mya arenaria]|uniref:Uncharacterized protein n=1 Tax=Mya arenaria TaxID=6604 RepID=A0ABY7DN30_MYAAR|nr:hypothetical protein MAR_023475 [Mya arenaria]
MAKSTYPMKPVGLSDDHILLITDAEAASFTCLEELHNIVANKKCLLVNWNENYTEFAEVESNFDQTIRVTFLEGKHSADMNTVQKKILSFMGMLLDDDTGIHFDDFRDKLDFKRKLKFPLK